MKNKRVILVVELDYSGHADFEDSAIKEITDNVAEAIKKRVDELGITPDGYEDAMLKCIRVIENYSNITTEVNV